HLAVADEEGAVLTQGQLDRFRSALATLRGQGIEPLYRHVSNSAGLIDLREVPELNLVRPGIMLYGYSPAAWLKADLQPVLSWKTAVTHLKTVPAGTPVSYGSTWKAPRESAIATLPVGYADGYSRQYSNR